MQLFSYTKLFRIVQNAARLALVVPSDEERKYIARFNTQQLKS